MICSTCKVEMTYLGESHTLVGYMSPSGHDHDDNCKIRRYHCEQCHSTVEESRQNRCHACAWTGDIECGCHEPRYKVKEWTDDTPPLFVTAHYKCECGKGVL